MRRLMLFSAFLVVPVLVSSAIVSCNGTESPTGASQLASTSNPSDATTRIANLSDVTPGEVETEPLPLNCAVLGDRRPAVSVSVRANEVIVTAVARGVGVPEEVDVTGAIVASVGRFRFWPNGRHRGPRVTSDVFPTIAAGDFPAEVELRYLYPEGTPPGAVLAALDYELISACYDELTNELEIGGLDEFGTCRPGEFVILQCDRGLSYTIP